MTHNASNAGGGDPSVQGAPLLTFAVHWRLAFKMISISKIYEYSSQSSDRTLLAQCEGGSGSGVVLYLHSFCDDTEDTARNASHRPRMIFHCLNHHTHLLLTSFHLPCNIHSNAHLSSADIFRLYCCACSTHAVSIPCILPFLQTDQMCS